MQQSAPILRSEYADEFILSIKQIPELPPGAAADIVNAKATASWNKIKDNSLSFLRGYAGIPTSFDDVVGRKTTYMVYAGLYLYYLMSPRSEKFAACDGNALCLHTSSLISAYDKNTVSFPLASGITAVSSEFGPPNDWSGVSYFWISNTYGQDKTEKATILSPCKADVVVSPPVHKNSDCRAVNTSTIAYSVTKMGCVCTKIGFGIYSNFNLKSDEKFGGTEESGSYMMLDTQYYLEKYGRCPTFSELERRDAYVITGSNWDPSFSSTSFPEYKTTDINSGGYTCASEPEFLPVVFTVLHPTDPKSNIAYKYDDLRCTALKTTYCNRDYDRDTPRTCTTINTCLSPAVYNPFKAHMKASDCTSGDYLGCARDDFFNRFGNNLLNSDIDAMNAGINLFRINVLNTQIDTEDNVILVNRCLTVKNDESYNTGWHDLQYGYDAVTVNPSFQSIQKYSKIGYDYNYCVYNKASRAESYKSTLDTISLVGSIALAPVTGGASLAAQFALGAAQAVGDINLNQNTVWPCYQGEGRPLFGGAVFDFIDMSFLAKDGCKSYCINGVDEESGNCK